MKKNVRFTKYVTIFLFFVNNSFAQGPIPPQTIVLEAGDTAAFTHAPANFDSHRDNVEHGKIDTLTYDSKTVGTKRKLVVYTGDSLLKNCFNVAISYTLCPMVDGLPYKKNDYTLSSHNKLL